MKRRFNLLGGIAMLLSLSGLVLLVSNAAPAESSTAQLLIPDVLCPPDVEHAYVDKEVWRRAGLFIPTGNTLNFSEHSCFQDLSGLEIGEHSYVTFSIEVIRDDWYTFMFGADFPAHFSIYQDDFFSFDPCRNFMGGGPSSYTLPNTGTLDMTSNHLSFYLQASQSLTIVISTLEIGEIGNMEFLAFGETEGVILGPGQATSRELEFDLFCQDTSAIFFENVHNWQVNFDGSLDLAATRELYFDGDQAAVEAFFAKLNQTGIPVVTDDCGPLTVRLEDEFTTIGDCTTWTLTRTIRAFPADASCPFQVASCEQRINFRRAELSDIRLPPSNYRLSCEDNFATDGATGGPDDNPDSAVTSPPHVQAFTGVASIADSTFCVVGASYSDEPRIDICDSDYRFRREWNLANWCNPTESMTYDQIVSVEDNAGPIVTPAETEIVIPVSPFSCQANVLIPVPEVTDRFGCTESFPTVFAIQSGGSSVIASGNLLDSNILVLSVGEYDIIRCGEDACGNETCVLTPLSIIESVEPIAVCQDTVTVFIGGGDIANGIEGIARVFPEDIDGGSSDNCGPVEYEIRRNYWRNWTCHPDSNRYSPWGGFVDFYCCDIDNVITAELRVRDDADLENICLTTILVEDRLNPFCYPPDHESFSCGAAPGDYPDDIEEAYSADFGATSRLMDDLFGAASGTDNCAVDTIVERTPLIQLNECGVGTITRFFEAWQAMPDADLSDGLQEEEAHRSTNSCTQVITIQSGTDFEIAFPADVTTDCEMPEASEVEMITNGCDVFGVNASVTAAYPAVGAECYQVAITYDVINWCQWDGAYEGFEIARLTEEDGDSLATGFSVEPAERPILRLTSELGPDDEDCDGELSTSENEPDDANDLRYYLTIDRSHPDTEGDSALPDEQYDNEAETSPECLPADANGLRNYGRYRYTQMVRVFNAADLEVEVEEFGGPTDSCPNLLPGQFGTENPDCEMEVSIILRPSSSCALADELGLAAASLLGAQLDAFAVDTSGDGEVAADEFTADQEIADQIIANADGTFSLVGSFPIIPSSEGENVFHAIRVVFQDACGNQAIQYVTFDVMDCYGPDPICINGVTVNLTLQDDGTCSKTLNVMEFVASTAYDCTGQGPEMQNGRLAVDSYAIYRAVDVEADPNFVPSPADSTITLIDTDDETTVVYLYAFDQEGNYSFCETYILVQLSIDCLGTIAGSITTRDMEGVEGAAVDLGGIIVPELTDDDGFYSITQLSRQESYPIAPVLDSDHSNGVKTIDLIILAKHLNGIDLMENPYQLIAADVDRSGTIAWDDFEILRQLILGNIDALPGNTSWRFIVADYVFPVPTNPWMEAFPETIFLDNLLVDILDADFIGIKIGDLDNSAEANAQEGAYERQLTGQYYLETDDMELIAGETYTIPIRANLAEIDALQGTIELTGLELLDSEYSLVGENYFGQRFLEQGYLTFSWNNEKSSPRTDAIYRVDKPAETLFSLVIRAQENIRLSKALHISSRYTPAEAYAFFAPTSTQEQGAQVFELGMNFLGTQLMTEVDTPQLHQNVPNPFAEETLIRFYLPDSDQATLTISDLSGRVIAQISAKYSSGYHTIAVTQKMLNGASGVFYYTLHSGTSLATRKMVLLD